MNQPLKPRRQRRDGWSVQAQRAFVAALVETGSARLAAAAAGKSLTAAYALRRDPRATAFALAWERATACRRQLWLKEAERRALHGDEVPIIRQGAVVATRTRYSDRLLAFLITRADRQIDALAPLPRDLHGDEDAAFDAALELLTDVRGAPPAPAPAKVECQSRRPAFPD